MRRCALQWRVSIPPGFRELKEAIGFAAANGPWFEKIEDGRVIRGFLPGPQHANALGIVHGGMLAAFLNSAMGTAVFHTLERRAVTLRLSLDYLGPGRIGDWLQAEGAWWATTSMWRRCGAVSMVRATKCWRGWARLPC